MGCVYGSFDDGFRGFGWIQRLDFFVVIFLRYMWMSHELWKARQATFLTWRIFESIQYVLCMCIFLGCAIEIL